MTLVLAEPSWDLVVAFGLHTVRLVSRLESASHARYHPNGVPANQHALWNKHYHTYISNARKR